MSYPSDQTPPPGWSTAPGSPAGPAPYTQPLAPPPAPPAAKRSAAAIVFGILAGLLLLSTLGVSGLYLTDKRSTNKTIADQKAQISTLTQDAATQADKLSKTEKDLATARDEVAQSQACLDAVRAFFKALKDDDKPAGERAALLMVSNCPGVEIT